MHVSLCTCSTAVWVWDTHGALRSTVPGSLVVLHDCSCTHNARVGIDMACGLTLCVLHVIGAWATPSTAMDGQVAQPNDDPPQYASTLLPPWPQKAGMANWSLSNRQVCGQQEGVGAPP